MLFQKHEAGRNYGITNGCKLSWGLIGTAMYAMCPQIDERRNTEILLFIALIIRRSRIAYANPTCPPPPSPPSRSLIGLIVGHKCKRKYLE